MLDTPLPKVVIDHVIGPGGVFGKAWPALLVFPDPPGDTGRRIKAEVVEETGAVSGSLTEIVLPATEEVDDLIGSVLYDLDHLGIEIGGQQGIVFHVNARIITRHLHGSKERIHSVPLLVHAPFRLGQTAFQIINIRLTGFDPSNDDSHVVLTCSRRAW